jgi:hypothetical protein
MTKRSLGIAVLAALASLALATCAYFVGFWPQRLAVTVEGPAGWRLTRIDDREVDEPLPARASKYLGFRPDGQDVTCRLEVANGAARARCRVRAWNVGGFITGHQALPRGVESLDGSLWLIGDWAVTAHPAVPGRVWFGCDSWGRNELRIDGLVSEHTNAHAHSTSADDAWHEVAGGGWTLSYLADAGTSVRLAEWGSPTETIVRCDDAGFASGTLAVDGARPQPLALDRPVKVAGREFELGLDGRDGRRAQVRLKRQGDLRLTLRVSQ